MTSTTGERTFSTSGRKVSDLKPPLLPAGTYDLVVDASSADVGKADRPDAVPYVNIRFTALNTATKEGGKDRKLFHRLLLSLKAGKDGIMNMDRGGGLTALAKALGTEIEGVEIVSQDVSDVNGNPVTIEYLNPRQVVEWVKSFDGSKLKARVKVQKGTAEYPDDKNEIAAFMTAE